MTMRYKDEFVAFILTHGRPEKVVTHRTLKQRGYTGRLIYVVDSGDSMVSEYQRKFGKSNVVIFDKEDIATRMDQGDNRTDRLSIVYARNACFEIAAQLNYKYFIQLEDDYVGFYHTFDPQRNYITKNKHIHDLDGVFDTMVDFYNDTSATCVAMLQGGDLIGGPGGSIWTKVTRKAMNTLVCSTDNPFQFVGRMNDDVSTYILLGSRGHLFFSIPNTNLQQTATQSQAGGLTDMYKAYGTYTKSFYSVMYNPSSVRIGMMGYAHPRLHHIIKWNMAVPKIISQRHKK